MPLKRKAPPPDSSEGHNTLKCSGEHKENNHGAQKKQDAFAYSRDCRIAPQKARVCHARLMLVELSMFIEDCDTLQESCHRKFARALAYILKYQAPCIVQFGKRRPRQTNVLITKKYPTEMGIIVHEPRAFDGLKWEGLTRKSLHVEAEQLGIKVSSAYLDYVFEKASSCKRAYGGNIIRGAVGE